MLPKSLDLLERAIQHAESERALSRQLGLTSSTLGAARVRGHLSPGLAAMLASHIGESDDQAARWCLIAVAESERSAKLRPSLQKIAEGLKSYFLTARPRRSGAKRKP